MGVGVSLRASPWAKLSEVKENMEKFTFGKKPGALLILYGRERETPEDQAFDEMLEDPDDAGPSLQLSGILRTLTDGARDQKIKLLLRVHRNLYHKPATQPVPVFQRAGVPLRTLELRKPALDVCVDCRRWAKVGTKPSVSVQISKKFGEVVFADLVFLGEWIFQVFVDQAT
eukprot:3213935-Alexandrium_andersonii.AAC.1